MQYMANALLPSLICSTSRHIGAGESVFHTCDPEATHLSCTGSKLAGLKNTLNYKQMFENTDIIPGGHGTPQIRVPPKEEGTVHLDQLINHHKSPE